MGPHGEVGDVLVYADDLALARAAFNPPFSSSRNRGLRLRQGALILEQHKPK